MMGEKQRWHFPPGLLASTLCLLLLSKPAHICLGAKGSWMGRQEYQWCDPNPSTGPTRGPTQTPKHTLWFCDLRGTQPELCNAAFIPLQVSSPPHPDSPALHTYSHHQAEGQAGEFT